MDEIGFRIWLTAHKTNSKVIGDIISRLKRIEKEFDYCDLDEEYKNNRCNKIIAALDYNGENKVMAEYSGVNLPIGKYYMSTFRYALKKYVAFCDEHSQLS